MKNDLSIITCDCDRSIFGVFDACSHLLVCLDNKLLFVNIEATWFSKSEGIAIDLFFAENKSSMYKCTEPRINKCAISTKAFYLC